MNDMENKQKHLEFIQNIINRMSQNSFSLKQWTITIIVVAILFIKNTAPDFIIFIIIPIVIFWILDGYFLSRERLFRKLYDDVRQMDEKRIDFSMEIRKYTQNKCNEIISSLVSIVPLLFYGTLLIMVLVIIKFI